MQKYVLSIVVLAVALVAFGARTAQAIPNFAKEFKAKYVKADSSDPKDVAFAEAVAAAKCNLCHAGKSKEDRNPYGAELAKLLDKKDDKDNVEKIGLSLDEVAKKKAKPDDPNCPTYGDLILQGKLPCEEEK